MRKILNNESAFLNFMSSLQYFLRHFRHTRWQLLLKTFLLKTEMKKDPIQSQNKPPNQEIRLLSFFF